MSTTTAKATGEQISSWLLQRNPHGDTPLHLACASEGKNETENTDMKLLLLSWVMDKGLLPRIIQEEDEDTEVERLRLVLPSLGALLVPDGQELKIDESDRQSKEEWLLAYANLPHAALALCVAQLFLRAWDEKKAWEEQEVWKSMHKVIDRPSTLAEAFLRVVELAQDASDMEAYNIRKNRTIAAQNFAELSQRLQLAAATCLDDLGSDMLLALICSREGNQALNLACQEEQALLLSQPGLQSAIKWKWRGTKLHTLIEEPSVSSALDLLLCISINLLLLPFVALTPRLAERTQKRGWSQLLGVDGYLLQVAVFQASLFAACDLAFSIIMTSSMHQLPFFLFAWTAAALKFEIDQVDGRPTSRSQGIWGKIRSYMHQDIFNVLDATALFVSLITLGVGLWIKWVLGHSLHGVGYYAFARQQPTLAMSYENGAAVAVLLLWLRQLRLLTLMFPKSMAPLVLMFASMIKDVCQFLLLLTFVLAAFSSALTQLDLVGDPELASSYYPIEGGEDCVEVFTELSSFGTAFRKLFEGSLLGDVYYLDCLRDSRHAHSAVGLMYLFVIFTVLLLLNMIIAMMGKTFDKFWEAAREQAATQFAKTVQDWEDQTEMPAPFLLLALPSSLFDSLRAMYACSRNCINGTLAYTMRQSTHKQLHDELDLLPCLSPRMQQKVYHVRRVELANLKEKVTEELLEKFGQYDSTAELIDQAVKFLASKIDTQRAVPRSNLGQHLEGSSSTFDDTCA